MHTLYAHFLCLESLTHARLVPAYLEYWHNSYLENWHNKGASRGESNACTRLMAGKGMIWELVYLYCTEVGGKTRVKCEKEAP